MRQFAILVLAAICLLPAFQVPTRSADVLKGDEAKDAKSRLRDIKREWKKASKADKLVLLRELSRLPEKSVGHFLEDVVEDEEDDGVAARGAWALVRHGDPEDADELMKAYKKAKDAGRRAAALRWLGLYGDEAPLEDLREIALGQDPSAEAATQAISDIGNEKSRDELELIAKSSKLPEARKVAVASLLESGDKRGVECMSSSANIEDAAWAAHFAIGTELETDALAQVLEYAKRPYKAVAGKRPQYFGSLLARLTRQESHEAVAAGGFSGAFDVEYGWWMISCNRAQADFQAASRWLRDDDIPDILNGLRYLQRLPEPLKGDAAQSAGEAIAPLLEHADDNVVVHALLTCIATGVCKSAAEAKAEAWLKDDLAFRRAGALLVAGKLGMKKAGDVALEALKNDAWYVQSAALDCLLYLRQRTCDWAVLDYAEKHGEGRLFEEAIALLVDLTGQDFGDALDKWTDWLKANEKWELRDRKLDSLRGVPVTRLKDKTGASFYGLRINSNNVQFALDRSVSMVNPVSREPARADFPSRKEDILKRRPEVGRMVRDGFLPRFYAAAAELHAALDGMTQNAKVGLTLFNHEQLEHERVENDIKNRRDLVNWMLSTDIQGGTDIKAALLSIIEKGEADTIVLLSDGEPMSLSILEMIARENIVKRVNILVVSIHKELYHRHYLDALATRHYGKCVDAEPSE
ncbi:MAG: hypothetical protein KDB32_06925 [Planctomycetes bacterium]|nr:hypothetical protein [Planctomycetota bacterium]